MKLFLSFCHLVVITISMPVFEKIPAQDSLRLSAPCKDSSEVFNTIEKITIAGNQKTKESIILRELSFKEGDCFNDKDLNTVIEQSEINLLKMPLFNYVTINYTISQSKLVCINIIVEERWYLWPQAAIINNERNFNNWWQNKDFSKLDYRLAIKKYNVLGLNHILKIGISTGFTQEISAAYQNVAIDRQQKHLLGISGIYFQYQSVFYNTFSNKQVSIENSANKVLSGKSIRLEYTFRPAIRSIHKIFTAYQELNAADSLVQLNPDYLAGRQNNNSYFEIQYQFTFDKRDSRSYPLSGNMFSFSLTKTGLGFPKNSYVNLLNFRTSFRQFYRISERFYGAHSISIKKSFENFQPYYYRRGLGYNDFLRGFEYYVIDGEDFYLSKNVIKFELLPKKISYLDFIPIKKFKKIHYAFYINGFFDIGYAYEKNQEYHAVNNLSNRMLYSSGLGVDLVTYYDKVIRLEYSLNSLGETGFFIHFVSPI